MCARILPSILLFFLSISISTPLSAQLEMKLQLMEENKWGVYVKPVGIIPSPGTITGSGAVTVVMPAGNFISSFSSVNGLWGQNSIVVSPIQNPDMQYLTFGLLIAEPTFPIPLGTEETLLFTYQLDNCVDTMYLFDCGTPIQTDSLCCIYNVDGCLSGNDLSVIDFTSTTEFYNFSNIYAPSAWNCHDSDGDGILNAFEDTNGNGIYDPDIDESDLNDPNSPLPPGILLKLQVQPGGESWGVYARMEGMNEEGETITGSGLVTVVMPDGFSWYGLNPISGLWKNDATVYNPPENPAKDYVSFSLLQAEPSYPILYQNEEDVLLFTFRGESGCPDSLYLIDCYTPNESDPFCPPNSANSNPGNGLQVIQFNPQLNFYNFTDLYAPMAWNCDDNDNDGYPNGLEDTNGNGIYDAGDDGDLNDPNSPIIAFDDSLELNVRMLAGRVSWGVFLKPANTNGALNNFILESGNITVGATEGFNLKNIESHASGVWTLETTQTQSGNNYFAFDLSPDEEGISFDDGEVMLFSFAKDGDCPDELFLIDDSSPDNILPSNMSGVDYGVFPPKGFRLIGNYFTKNLNCLSEETPGGLDDDGFNSPGGNSSSFLNKPEWGGIAVGESSNEILIFYPNPANDFLEIQFSGTMIKFQVVDIHGRVVIADNIQKSNAVKFNVDQIPSGLYILSVTSQDGTIHKGRFIKN